MTLTIARPRPSASSSSLEQKGPSTREPNLIPAFTQIRGVVDRLIDTVERIARRAALPTLRIGLAVIMIWFGAPKLFPGGSPAETIAVDTVSILSGGMVTGDFARLVLGLVEVGLGVGLLIPRLRLIVLLALIGHMCATFTPLVLFPHLTWHAPFVGSLEGQYILKNILIIGAILVLLGFSREDALRRRR